MKRSASIALALILALAGGALAQQSEPSPPPGRLIDVGGHRLHLHCLGDAGPTVVFDVGAGAWSIHARSVQRRVAREAAVRACTYDRAGLGWSEPGPGPRTSRRMASELHAMLDRAGLDPPYLLVGHSLGGYNARLFAEAHPHDVAGIVLVESAHEEQWDRLPDEARALVAATVAGFRQAAGAARAGAISLEMLPPCDLDEADACRAREAEMLEAVTYETMAAEMDGAFESAAEVASTGDLGDLPLAVVSARRSFDVFEGTGIPRPEADVAWMEMQRELVDLSTRSTHYISEKGDHRILQTDPDRVIEAILDVLERARRAR